MISSPSSSGGTVVGPLLAQALIPPPSKGMKLPNVPLDAFRLCMVKTKAIYEIVYVGLALFFG